MHNEIDGSVDGMNGDLGRPLPPDIAVRKQQCSTCVFKAECDGGIELTPNRHGEIHDNLLRGVNQLCHGDDDKTICRGGRDFQLQCWSRLGIIAAPTDEALTEAMIAMGVTPRERHNNAKAT